MLILLKLNSVNRPLIFQNHGINLDEADTPPGSLISIILPKASFGTGVKYGTP